MLVELKDKYPNDFTKKAKSLLKQFNRFQVTEYNTLVARCRTAKQFSSFARTGGVYQNLEWVRTRSASPRELHLSFAGIVQPSSSKFWIEHQPGDLYGCKCDVRRTLKPVTEVPAEASRVTPSRGLEGNPYLTRRAYTNEHPYFNPKRISSDGRAAIEQTVQNHLLNLFQKVDGITKAPFGDYATDFPDLKIIAKHFMGKGEKTYIMPKITHYDNDLYKYLFQGANERKCPDLLISGKWFEYESYESLGENTLNRMVNRAISQANNIIVDVRKTQYTIRDVSDKVRAKNNIGIKTSSAYALTVNGIVKVL